MNIESENNTAGSELSRDKSPSRSEQPQSWLDGLRDRQRQELQSIIVDQSNRNPDKEAFDTRAFEQVYGLSDDGRPWDSDLATLEALRREYYLDAWHIKTIDEFAKWKHSNDRSLNE